jgi:flagella basal body P-ring formation protein FlgA
VVAVRFAVERGAVIGREDLMAVQVGLDPALTPIPAAQVETLVGQRAAVDMAAGTLVTREQISATVLPPRGFSVVGVALRRRCCRGSRWSRATVWWSPPPALAARSSTQRR